MSLKSILILYTEVMGYTMASVKRLVEMYPVSVHLIGWDTGKQTPFIVKPNDHIEYKGKSEFKGRNEIFKYAVSVDPKIVFISGWMDRDYLFVAKQLRKKGILIVSFCDNQWSGSLRQWLARLIAPVYLRMKFDYLWVSGKQQLLFAQKMGFPQSKILFGFCPADVDYFSKVGLERDKQIQNQEYPYRITFLGRFIEAKGLDLLIEVFIRNQERWKVWTLVLIGNGPLKDELKKKYGHIAQISIEDFKQPEMLKHDIINTGIFVLPSRKEPWGVVIHEFAAAGVPLIVSDVCGAGSEFVNEGINGFTFHSDSMIDLEAKLNHLITSPDKNKIEMGIQSRRLSRKYSPDTWATTVYKLL